MQAIGVTKGDIKKFKNIVHKVNKKAGLSWFNDFIKSQDNSLMPIDKDKLNEEMKNRELSADQECYIRKMVYFINCEEKHYIEFERMYNSHTSEEGKSAFEKHFNSIAPNSGSAQLEHFRLGNKNMTGLRWDLVRGMGAEGLNVPTENGSHSFITGINKKLYEVTVIHETLGHGIPSSLKWSAADNNKHAIQMDSLIRRLIGEEERNDPGHGFKKGDSIINQLPE